MTRLALTLAALAALAFVACSSSDDDDDAPTAASADTPSSTATPAAATNTATPRPTNTPAATATATPNPKPKVGTTVTTKGTKYTVNEVRDNIPGDRFNVVPEGKRWVAFDVTVEAVTAGSYNPFDYSLQDARAFVYDPGFTSTTAPQPRLSSGELAAGGTVRGWITFTVPADAVLTALRVEPDFNSPAVIIADLTQ